MPRRSQPEELRRLVPRVLHELGLDAPAQVVRISERWEEVVGPEIARRCRPLALRGAILEAEVESSVWAQQLQLRKAEILEALRREFGDEAPAGLRFRVGQARERR